MSFSFWWVGLHVQAWTTVASLAFHPELKMDAVRICREMSRK